MTRRPYPNRILSLAPLAALLVVGFGLAARADVRPAHVTLKSARAQERREQIFKHLMTGQTPTFMQGKSSAQVRAWSQRLHRAIDRNAEKAVRRIVANPSATPSRGEQLVLGLASPQTRAKLLKDLAGFKVEQVKYKVNGVPTDKLKITLKRYGQGNYSYSYYGSTSSPEYEKQMQIFNRVMSPNVITYAPAGGHSKYVSQGQVFDIYGSSNYGELRPNKYPLFPTWLSDGEAGRMIDLVKVANGSWSSAMGQQLSHGRPGMWPPTPTQRSKTGNSCTTTFIRAPVGERSPQYAWIDALQDKVAAAAKGGRLQVQGLDLSKQRLLQAITGKDQQAYREVFTALKRQLPGEARNLDKLQGQVDFFYDKLNRSSTYSYSYYGSGSPSCTFPMDLMHRAPLAKMANITGDPVGPGMAKQKFRAGDPTRLGVVAVFEKERR